MATVWCPRCRSECREGFSECADCGVALVPVVPPEPDTASRAPSPRPIGPMKPEDEPVELMRVNPVEAELVAAHLRDEGIGAVVLDVGTGPYVALQYSEGSRVMVRRADLRAARAAVADLSGDERLAAPIDDLAAQAEAASDWSDPGSGAVV